MTTSLSCRIACLSCPTLYSKLAQMQAPSHHTVLLEYDKRFQKYGEHFIHYDYRQPLQLPGNLQEGSFDLVVADPPFLSEECLSKVADTVKFLTRQKIILCTGTWYANECAPPTLWGRTKKLIYNRALPICRVNFFFPYVL